MSSVKDLYMDEVERRAEVLVEGGMDEEQAYEVASEAAYHGLGDAMADLADQARQRAKDEG